MAGEVAMGLLATLHPGPVPPVCAVASFVSVSRTNHTQHQAKVYITCLNKATHLHV